MKNNSSRRNFIKTTGQGLIAIPVANSLNGLIIGSNKTPEKRKDVSTIVHQRESSTYAILARLVTERQRIQQLFSKLSIAAVCMEEGKLNFNKYPELVHHPENKVEYSESSKCMDEPVPLTAILFKPSKENIGYLTEII